jgi:hypothetical protein
VWLRGVHGERSRGASPVTSISRHEPCHAGTVNRDASAVRKDWLTDVPVGDAPLVGLRVLEPGNFIAGPFTTRLFADFGAEVNKIERPDGGDELRGWRRPRGATPRCCCAPSRGTRSPSHSTCAPTRSGDIALSAGAARRRRRGELPARHARTLGSRARPDEPHQPRCRPGADLRVGQTGPLPRPCGLGRRRPGVRRPASGHRVSGSTAGTPGSADRGHDCRAVRRAGAR